MDKSVRAKLSHWFAKEMYLTQKTEIKSRFLEELDDLRPLRKRMDDLEQSNYGQMIPEVRILKIKNTSSPKEYERISIYSDGLKSNWKAYAIIPESSRNRSRD